MTTIAYKDGVVCADSSTNYGDVRFKSTKKIVDHGDVVVASAGDADDRHINALFHILNDEDDFPSNIELRDVKQVFVAFVFTRQTGQVFIVQTGDEYPLIVECKEPHFAIGTGGELAIGAMSAGATAKEAVKIACKWDIKSATPIQEVRLWNLGS